MIHVIPVNDTLPHTQESTCECRPVVRIENGEMICIHKAWDGRELIEEGLQPGLPTFVKARCGRDLVEGDVVESLQGNRFLVLTIMGISPRIMDKDKKFWDLVPEMSSNLFYVGNVMENIDLRNEFKRM